MICPFCDYEIEYTHIREHFEIAQHPYKEGIPNIELSQPFPIASTMGERFHIPIGKDDAIYFQYRVVREDYRLKLRMKMFSIFETRRLRIAVGSSSEQSQCIHDVICNYKLKILDVVLVDFVELLTNIRWKHGDSMIISLEVIN